MGLRFDTRKLGNRLTLWGYPPAPSIVELLPERASRQQRASQCCVTRALVACAGPIGVDWGFGRRLQCVSRVQQFSGRPRQTKRRCAEAVPGNHLEERLLDQAQARASYTPLFWGHSRSIPQGMILDVQPFVKSLFCPIRPSPNGFFDSEASVP